MRLATLFSFLLLASASLGCAPTPSVPTTHGTLSTLSIVEDSSPTLCVHKVPDKVCTRCHPELAARFKAVGDWCPEHGVPESQCLICHPELTFTPLPELPPNSDVRQIATRGEDIASLDPHAVPGKVTLFDFYAEWCAPCRQVDRHVYGLVAQRSDIAYRKLDIVSWETPLARHHLANVPKLPYVIVYGKDGRVAGNVSGLDLEALDRLIAKAAK